MVAMFYITFTWPKGLRLKLPIKMLLLLYWLPCHTMQNVGPETWTRLICQSRAGQWYKLRMIKRFHFSTITTVSKVRRHCHRFGIWRFLLLYSDTQVCLYSYSSSSLLNTIHTHRGVFWCCNFAPVIIAIAYLVKISLSSCMWIVGLRCKLR